MDIAEIAARLDACGFATVENSLPVELLARLDHACHDSLEFPFVPAGTGRGAVHQPQGSIRGDIISWLDSAKETDQAYLGLMEHLRVTLNQLLYLGLFEFQGHYAIYEAGTHYDRHLDSLVGRRNRVLSTVVYLDPGWAPADGGELLLYRADAPKALARILPRPGLMVLFLSEEFPHEVLAATRARRSIAGWFSGRPSTPGHDRA